MPEFNNINYELNNGEKFALICGMLAGLKLQDTTQPPTQVTVTLEPIGVNGLGGIGLMASDIEYKGINAIRVPVVTHDVDREYAGFSLSVSYDSNRMVISSIDEGDFCTLMGTSLTRGKAYTSGMLDKGKNIKDVKIVCWLNCLILDPPTKSKPIEIKFNNSSGYNPNYCTLLTWVLNEVDNNYYSYFITPTVNQGFKIISNEEKNNTSNPPASNLGDSHEIAAKASPSLLALGTAYIKPGKRGLIPIYTNSNKDNNFPYNEFKLTAIVPYEWLNILDTIDLEATGEWELTYSKSYDTKGNLVLDINGKRAEAKIDNSTAGFIRFELNEEADSISCTIINDYSELIGDSGSLGVVKGNGYLYYPKNGSSPSDSDGWGSGVTSGGMIGSGVIWSSTSQTIWIDLGNGNKYPVQLEPGPNKVEINIPNILPEDKWEETTPKIEAPGYILIPGGFEWQIIITPEAPLGLSSPRIVDRFEIKDIYLVEKITQDIPVDLDNILDEYLFNDNGTVDVNKVNILLKDFIDTFEVNDTMKIEIVNMMEKDEDFIDNIELRDFMALELERDGGDTPEEPPEEQPDIIDASEVDSYYEDYTLTDKADTVLINLSIINNPNSEHIELGDMSSTEALNCIISSLSQIEEIEITDLTDLDINPEQ